MPKCQMSFIPSLLTRYDYSSVSQFLINGSKKREKKKKSNPNSNPIQSVLLFSLLLSHYID